MITTKRAGRTKVGDAPDKIVNHASVVLFKSLQFHLLTKRLLSLEVLSSRQLHGVKQLSQSKNKDEHTFNSSSVSSVRASSNNLVFLAFFGLAALRLWSSVTSASGDSEAAIAARSSCDMISWLNVSGGAGVPARENGMASAFSLSSPGACSTVSLRP